MKYRKELALSAACYLLAFFCFMIWQIPQNKNLAQQISPHILRFHVLANSNSRKDQELKLNVKNLLLDQLAQAGADTKEELEQYVLSQKDTLETCAEDYMRSQGYPYEASITIANTYFPTKSYGDIVLPRGDYDAVEVTLGQGRGRNWWCVLYPRLCFIDATHAVVPETSKEQLQSLLTDEEYQAILDKKDLQVKIRFRFWDSLKTTFLNQ